MAQVTFEMTAKVENAIRALLSVEGAHGKIETAAKKASKASGNEAGGLGDVLKSLGVSGPSDLGKIVGAITGAGGVLWAISEIKASWTQWRNDIKKAGEDMAATTRELGKNISISGDTKDFGKINFAMQHIATAVGMDDKDVGGIFSAARSSNRLASTDKIVDITRTAARARGAFVGDVASQQQLGKIMAGLAKIYPTASTNDLGDMAKQYMDAGGTADDADILALNKLTAGGISPDAAMGLALAAAEQGLPAKSLGGLADILTLPMNVGKGDSLFKTQFALERDPNKRLDMLYNGGKTNRAEVLVGSANEFETALLGHPRDQALAVDAARRDDRLRQDSVTMLANKDVQDAINLQTAKTVKGEMLETPGAMTIAQKDAARDVALQIFRKRHPIAGMLVPFFNMIADTHDAATVQDDPANYLNAQTGQMETKEAHESRFINALNNHTRALTSPQGDGEPMGNSGLYP
jgi:hypothetical protein